MPHSAGAGKVANTSSQASSSFPSQVDVPMWEQYGAHLAEICKEVLEIGGEVDEGFPYGQCRHLLSYGGPVGAPDGRHRVGASRRRH